MISLLPIHWRWLVIPCTVGMIILLTARLATAQIYTYSTTCAAPQSIPDNGCSTADSLRIVFDVNDLPTGARLGTDIFIAELRLIIAHTFTSDIDIRLSSPSGRSIILTSDNGSGEDNYGDPMSADCSVYTAFVPTACANITEGVAPFIGSFAPEESFVRLLDDSPATGNWVLSICDDVADDLGALTYAELILTEQECTQPLDVVVQEADSTTIVLDWFSAGFCENSIIEYGASGFVPGNGTTAGEGTVVMADCPPYALTNLPENTTLDIYIRTDCGGTVAANSCVITATTLCELAPVTFREDFDNAALCVTDCNIPCPLMGIWQNDVQDDFDWLVNSGTTPSPNTGPSADADGDGQYVYIESSGASCSDQSRAILLSDCLEINTQGTADCHFSFEYHAFGTRIDTLFLDISLDAGGTWRNLWKTNGNKGDQWLKTYINLTDYEGQTARLRFVATGGRGNVSDIALDNLIFYGSTPTSSSTEVYYLDADSDGFGNPNISLEACDGIVPTGYVLDNTDCDDSNPSANPDAEELPCNGIDENCNGLTDDFELSPPIVDDVTICSGETGVIFSTLTEGDYVFWYDAPTAGSIVFPDFGSGFPFTAPENLSDTTQVYTFYAEAKSNTNFNCVSQPRTPASFIVPPNPQLSVREQALVCEGQLLNLSNLNVFDERNTGATISFHTAFPPTTDNELSNTNAIIRSDTTFYLLATSPDACTDMDSITIEAINGIDFDIRQGDSLSICLDATDTLQLDINALGDNYTVEWNTGDTTEFLPIRANAQPGFVDRYLVIVTSETGCQRTDFIYVTTVESIDSVRTNITDVSACSTTDGTISLQPQGGVSPFSYEWSGAVSGTQSNVNGDYTIQNLPTGTYSVTIIDNSTAACPKIINNLVVNQPVAEVTIASLREVSCFAASDGRIAISVAGNDPQVEWNTGARGTVIEELRADTYSVSVMDNDCETVLDIVLSEPAALQLNPEVTHPRCADTNDGEIRLGVLGGTAPFRYQWSNNVTTRHLQDIPNGAYQVIVTDANDCQITSPTLSVAAPDSLQIRLDELLDVRCAEEQNGRILLTTQGGTAPYNYLWSDGTDTEDLTNISGGSYQLKITDAAGCEQRDSFFINNPTALSLADTRVQDASCPGVADGEIHLSIIGGSTADGSYGINFQGQSTTQTDFVALTSGDYTLEIFDDNGCRLDTILQLDAPDELVINATVVDPHCIGAPDGFIELGLAQPARSFLWNTGDTSSFVREIENGTYSVQIIDAFGCEYDTTFVLVGEQIFEYQTFARAPSCFDSNDGLINLNFVRGGRPPFRYEWNNQQNTPQVNELGAGIYQATVTDVDGCRYESDTFRLTAPDALRVMVMDSSVINCHGDRSGGVEVAVEGGTGDYRYFWDGNEQANASLVDVPAGIYELLVLDENDCTEELVVTFEQPSELILNAAVVAPDICNNVEQRVDSIQLMVNGGTPSYRFEWNTGDTTQHLKNVSTGNYEVSVTDEKGCIAMLDDIKVSKIPAPLFIDSMRVEDISCNGANDGSLSVTVSGGKSPYSYLWSPPLGGGVNATESGQISTGNVLATSGLGYNVTITDANNCRIVTDVVFVEEPASVTAQIDPNSITDVRCFGGNDGRAAARVIGGTGTNYTYEWVDQDTGLTVDSAVVATQLSAGNYLLRVTDGNGCEAENEPTVTIEEPNSLPTVDAVDMQQVQCYEESNGRISLEISGGVSPYTYTWSNGATTPNLTELSAGTYQLTLTDAMGCTIVSDTLLITQPDLPLLIAEIRVRDESCWQAGDGWIEQFASGGTSPYVYFFDDLPTRDNMVTGQARGEHYLTVVDANGCLSATDTVIIRSPDPVTVDIMTSSASSANTPDGTAMLTPVSGIVPFRYDWEIGDTTATIDNQFWGTYAVTVLDANSCQLDTLVQIDFLTDVEEIEIDFSKKIKLFPNPTTRIGYLDVGALSLDDFQIKCYSSLGNILFTKQIPENHSSIISLAVENLSAGLYFIGITHGDKILYFEKMIISE